MPLLQRFLSRRSLNPQGEMSFADHIEELRWHIIRSAIAILVGGIIAFAYIEWIFDHIILGPARADFPSYRILCEAGRAVHISALCLGNMQLEFQNTELSGQFMMSFSVSFMIGFILAFPVILMEVWKFIKPALKPSERRQAQGFVFWSSVLFFTGVLFAYFVVAPFTINFFANYQLSPRFRNIITMSNYYDTMSDLIMGMGIIFELPVLIYFLSRMGILNPEFLRNNRRYAVVIIMILAAVITPPDWFSIWLVAIPLLALYEIGIGISRRVRRDQLRKEIQNRS